MGSPSSAKPKVNPTWVPICEQYLQELVGHTPDILAAVLTTGDGFEVASHVPNEKMSPQRLSAMTSSMLGLAEALLSEAMLGPSQEVIVQAEKGQIFLLAVPNIKEGLLLNVTAGRNVLIGELLCACRQCCADISSALGGV